MSALRCLVRQGAAAVILAWARANSSWKGWPDAMAMATRRTDLRAGAASVSGGGRGVGAAGGGGGEPVVEGRARRHGDGDAADGPADLGADLERGEAERAAGGLG